VEAATQTFATVTLQNYFRMYHKLAGMTGTAETEAGEFWDIYKLDVVVIPTNRPVIRDDQNDIIYKTKKAKFNAVIDKVVELSEAGRPVLVGTTDVETSELLARMMRIRGITANVLNAKEHAREAEIVAQAGQKGKVTIATNMAGRGTDIKLSPEGKDASAAPPVTTAAAWTVSSADVPVDRETREAPASTFPWKTTSCASSAPKGLPAWWTSWAWPTTRPWFPACFPRASRAPRRRWKRTTSAGASAPWNTTT